jgi:hypothetical protein
LAGIKRVMLTVKEGGNVDNNSILIEQLLVRAGEWIYLLWKGMEEGKPYGLP